MKEQGSSDMFIHFIEIWGIFKLEFGLDFDIFGYLDEIFDCYILLLYLWFFVV